jgi:hypothetical protein
VSRTDPRSDPTIDAGATIDDVMNAFYASISGPAGERDWELQRSLFVPGGRLTAMSWNDGEPRLESMSLAEYAASRGPYFAANDFYEVEIARREQRWSSLALIASAYEGRRRQDGPAILRGLNLLHLVHLENRWWITAVTWKHERPDDRLPPEFLE